MSKNAYYSFDPIIVPGIILLQRLQFFFFFSMLNLIFVGRKKKRKICEKTKLEVQIDFGFGLLLGYKMLLWQRFMAPKVFCATVKSLPYSSRHSLGRASAWEGTCLAHCSLHMKITIILSSASLYFIYNWLSRNWVQTTVRLYLNPFTLRAEVCGCKDLTSHWPRSSQPFLTLRAWKLQRW